MLSVCKSASRKQAKKYFAKKLKNFIKILDKNEKMLYLCARKEERILTQNFLYSL